MTAPLVATKLFAPKLRGGLVRRPVLVERLRRGAETRLTLISAPAGFGKTTLLAEWLAQAPRKGPSIAWLSLDETDNELGAFWSHVIAALQTVTPDVGAGMLSALQAGQPPDDALLATLLNELGAIAGSIVLVLDDFHIVDSAAIAAGMAFVLDHLPPQVHLVISTRSDPALPLPRLRARGELVEIRSADLRFSREQTAAYLNDAMDLSLSETDVAALGERTEGWIAALQLAALSLDGRADVRAFVAGFTGNDRYIVDYLVEEVLHRQPGAVRDFLRRTCFLDRLSGPLCDAVTGTGGGRAMLEALERANLFLVPLDDRREWYRYHHLFADVLLTHFGDDAQRELPLLHRRAGDWFESQGERDSAVQHLLAAKDYERAAEVIELAMPELSRQRRDATMRDWIAALPDPMIRARPVLSVSYAGALTSIGQFDEVERRLADAERGLAALAAGPEAATAIVVTDARQLRTLPGAIEVYRAALAQVRGDLDATIAHAAKAVELAPAEDHLGRASAAGFLAIALWTRGDLAAAYRSWSECVDGLRRAGRIADVLGASLALGDISLTQGRLGDAARIFEDALALAREQGGPSLRGVADMHAGLSAVLVERNDIAAAREHLQRSAELGEQVGMPQHRHRWRIAMARVLEAEGDIEGALALLAEAERLFVPDFYPAVKPIAAMIARLRIAQGQLNHAARWQREVGVSADDVPSYLREFEHVTLARLMLARDPADAAAAGLLARLLDAAMRGGRDGSVIEIAALLALSHRARNDDDAALAALGQALTLAEPEGQVGVFVREGEPMAALLKLAARRGMAPAHARKLLAAFGPAEERPAQNHPDLIEPLSERELDVLKLLRSDLDGPDIARELRVSLNTMRTHTKAIYEKLGVNSRRAAVRRAEDLHLLQRG